MAKAQGLYSQNRDSVTGLTERQQRVLDGLTKPNDDGKVKTQTELAGELGISRQRVREIVTDLLRKGYVIPGARAPK